jgi:hypothetical protein
MGKSSIDLFQINNANNNNNNNNNNNTGVGQIHSSVTMQSSSTNDEIEWKRRKDKQV